MKRAKKPKVASRSFSVGKGLLFASVLVLALGAGIWVGAEDASSEGKSSESAVAESRESLESGVRRAQLEKRAAERRQHLLRQDYAVAYQFSTPAYRKLFDEVDFMGESAVSAQQLDVVVEGVQLGEELDVGEVSHRITYQVPLGPATVSVVVKERWLWRDADWWYVGDAGVDRSRVMAGDDKETAEKAAAVE